MRVRSDRDVIGIAIAKRDTASTNITICLRCSVDGGVMGPVVSLLMPSAGEYGMFVVR